MPGPAPRRIHGGRGYNASLLGFANDGFRIDLDEDIGLDEAAHADHRRGGPDLAEQLGVGAAHFFRVADVREEHPRPYDVGQPGTRFLEGRLDLPEDVDRLAVRVPTSHDATPRIRRGGPRDDHERSDADRPRVSHDRLPDRPGGDVRSLHTPRSGSASKRLRPPTRTSQVSPRPWRREGVREGPSSPAGIGGLTTRPRRSPRPSLHPPTFGAPSNSVPRRP